MQQPTQTQTDLKQLKSLAELINLINCMIKVEDEATAKEVAAFINKHIDKIRVRIDFSLYPQIKTDITALTAVLLTVRQVGNVVSSIPFIKITLKNGQKCLYRSPSSLVTMQLMGYLVSLNLPMEMCFFEPLEKRDIQPWESKTVNQIYHSFIRQFYSLVHQQMGQYLAAFMLKNAESIKNVLLISAACGDAHDLSVISKYLTDFKMYCSGFDINNENLKLAKKLLPNGYFIQGEIKDIDKYLTEIKKNYSVKNTEPHKTVIIFSGILQRHLLSGSSEATSYLQIACRESHLAMMCSIQHSLTTRMIVKAIGYKVNMQNINFVSRLDRPETRILYCLENQNAQERLEYIIKRSNKRSPDRKPTNIDLSLSANPLADLLLIDQHDKQRCSETIQLDLSWSYITDEELKNLVKFIKENMIKLERIIIANVESWANKLLQMKLPFTIYKRNDVLNANEVPEFSVPSARFFQLYKTLPVTRLQDKPEDIKESVVQSCNIPKSTYSP